MCCKQEKSDSFFHEDLIVIGQRTMKRGNKETLTGLVHLRSPEKFFLDCRGMYNLEAWEGLLSPCNLL